MKQVISNLSEEQNKFIQTEFNISEEELKSMTDDEIYERIYDPCCVIEEVETVATIDDDSELSDRGRIASDIVTLLGETIED